MPPEGRKHLKSTRGRPRHNDILTPREWQVIDLLEQGLTNEQIAESLQVSFGGARFHVAETISKLGAQDRHEAVRLARGRQRRYAALLGLVLTRLRFAPTRPVPVGGAAAVVFLAAVLLLGALLATWFPWQSSGSNEPDLGQALADFESGDRPRQELGQAEFDPASCVTGEEARNRRYMDKVMAAAAAFYSIEEAERLLCMRLPHPRSADLKPYPGGKIDDGPLAPVLAMRPQDLEILLSPESSGKDHRRASLYFRSTRPGDKVIIFEVFMGGLRPMAGYTTEAVTIQGTEGQLLKELAFNPNSRVIVAWEKDGYGFMASMFRLQDFGREEFLAILETVS
jgi:DNA-binding CsgD family transcriptional regulator